MANISAAGADREEGAVSPGKLYLCATPIGNLEDITLRALRVLRTADLIAAEDTRQTVKLLNHYEIKAPLCSYHEHNRREKGEYLIARLLQGENVALVTDAGTPGISDPGYDLVRLALERTIPVIPIPGPTAFVAALIAAGLPTDRFVFEGFLPKRKTERRRALAGLVNESRTIIFYEAPHRILKLLADIAAVLGDRPVVLAREMTKKHEEFIRGTVLEVMHRLAATGPRGEFVVVLAGVGEAKEEPAAPAEMLRALLGQGLTKKDAIRLAAKELGRPKKEIYRMALDLEEEGG
ncbi:MAG: 16S rRNA (cytidine(1402)-2'-O)-methyltransferase [bacterium]|jgi:16S rRNA (cytidine1402-2'-O)-methyltransferase